jgi:dipeptidyl aminopeptidase/acylaminoacyl peptidase
MKNVPIWTFHGVDDVVVPQELSIQMTEAVNALGGKVKLTLYPGVNHNSWDNAFVEPKFLPWLFSHTLNR